MLSIQVSDADGARFVVACDGHEVAIVRGSKARISNAGVSGTASGRSIPHAPPEAAAGGPLAVVQPGDVIERDVPNRRQHPDIPDAEPARRLAQWPPRAGLTGGDARLHHRHVRGADTGADPAVLQDCRGNPVGRVSH